MILYQQKSETWSFKHVLFLHNNVNVNGVSILRNVIVKQTPPSIKRHIENTESQSKEGVVRPVTGSAVMRPVKELRPFGCNLLIF